LLGAGQAQTVKVCTIDPLQPQPLMRHDATEGAVGVENDVGEALIVPLRYRAAQSSDGKFISALASEEGNALPPTFCERRTIVLQFAVVSFEPSGGVGSTTFRKLEKVGSGGDAVTRGHNVNSTSALGHSEVLTVEFRPSRIVPDAGQLAEDTVEASRAKGKYVFHDCEAGS